MAEWNKLSEDLYFWTVAEVFTLRRKESQRAALNEHAAA